LMLLYEIEIAAYFLSVLNPFLSNKLGNQAFIYLYLFNVNLKKLNK
jgi:hypothetical protein